MYYCTMKHYFMLQHKMIDRKLIEFGVHPVLGYALIAIAFVIGSMVIYSRVLYPDYVYSLVATFTIIKLSEPKRNQFLKTCFNHLDYRKIRTIENLLLAIPFLIFMLWKGSYLFSLLLFIGSTIAAEYFNRYNWNQVIPTPFGKWPFEFTRGFRAAFILILLSYFLCFMGIRVDNFNLSLFSLGLLFVICISFNGETEGEYFVWIHRMTPKSFLLYKIKIALIYSIGLTLPIIIALLILFTSYVAPILIITCIGLLNVVTMVITRYSRYPKNMGLPESLLYVISALFSPLMIFALPYFYKRSINQLYKTLG